MYQLTVLSYLDRSHSVSLMIYGIRTALDDLHSFNGSIVFLLVPCSCFDAAIFWFLSNDDLRGLLDRNLAPDKIKKQSSGSNPLLCLII